MAKRLEDEHRQIRLGYRPAPTAAQKHRTRLFEAVRDEYLAWGQAQGGWRRKPWSPIHARNRRTQLTTWQERLGLKTLADLDGIQPRVERALRDLQAEGKAGKTLANYTEGLTAFCDWCVQRGYLANDPLKAMVPFDTTPQTTRRAMTLEEIAQVLNVADPPIRLLYETAFVSGLRANELRNLTLAHLDLERGGLILDAEWTKNRRKGFQPLPYTLIQRLVAFSDANQAQTLYKEAFSRGRAKQEFPKQPLLYVPSHPARSLDRDLKKAGIPKHNPHGKLDFHAARVAYINLLIDNGTITPKEVQELARHSTLDMTMRVYGRTQEGRMREAVEQVGESVLSEEKRATSVQKLAVGAEQEIATPLKTESCDSPKVAPAVGLEPPFPESPTRTKPTQNCAKSIQNKTLSTSPQTAQKQKSTVSEQNNAYSIHPKGVPGVYQNAPPTPDDLAQVVDAWDNLPKPVKAGILAMVRETRK